MTGFFIRVGDESLATFVAVKRHDVKKKDDTLHS